MAKGGMQWSAVSSGITSRGNFIHKDKDYKSASLVVFANTLIFQNSQTSLALNLKQNIWIKSFSLYHKHV